jgi:hypothetical protein
MKKKINDKDSIKIFGIKINGGVLVAMIILTVGFVYGGIMTIYSHYLFENGDTAIIVAEIIDVGTRRRGGLGVKPKIGYIRFKYNINGKEITHSAESFYIRDNIDKYHIGECIELLVSLEDEDIYKWDESKGTFKCQ